MRKTTAKAAKPVKKLDLYTGRRIKVRRGGQIVGAEVVEVGPSGVCLQWDDRPDSQSCATVDHTDIVG